MPGWHERTRALQEAGDINFVGIVVEQHADRARLFMQWRQMGWPVMVDALDLLEVEAVPIACLIDEEGIVVAVNPSADEFAGFVQKPVDDKIEPPSVQPSTARAPDLEVLERAAAGSDAPEDRSKLATAQFLWGGRDMLDSAIDNYRAALGRAPEDGWLHFRLGVALLERSQSDRARESDFAEAITHWRDALDVNPNQYIWRRRIQQYGPRLDKPYPFYDWVAAAREDISRRNEIATRLRTPPRGAEIAQPIRSGEQVREPQIEPDPDSRIEIDADPLIRVQSTIVPETGADPDSARIYLELRPDRKKQACWDNEAGDHLVWIDRSSGWQSSEHLLTLPTDSALSDQESKIVEFDVQRSDPAGSGTLTGYALYYVCEGAHGVCMYRRQSFEVDLGVLGRSTKEPAMQERSSE